MWPVQSILRRIRYSFAACEEKAWSAKSLKGKQLQYFVLLVLDTDAQDHLPSSN